MADERNITAFHEQIHLPDWLDDPDNPFPHPHVDVIGGPNAGPPDAYTKIVRDAFQAIDRHHHNEIDLSIETMEEQIEDLEGAVHVANNRKLPQGTAMTVTQTENVGFSLSLDGKTITGDNAVVTTVHADAPSYIYYNEPTKKWVIAELSTSATKDGSPLTTIPRKSYTVVVFTLKRW